MKKIITGAIAGALLLTSVSVFADSASLVGKKVQGLFTVEQNGTKIADAVIIDGVAYAPVRAVSQAAGVQLTVEGKKIIMKESESETTKAEPVATAIPEPTPVAPTATPMIDKSVVTKLNILNGKIMSLSANIALTEAQLKDDPNNSDLKKKVEDAKAQYNTLKAEYDQLKAESGL
ncbi:MULTISPECIES: hypothetical protein [Paenibacillus]|uniref:hypothetical protein n=1 Tax=Paenibacillus TaxID=44249 RepID=UPI00096C5822|nr:hypothetical protein [Paenibacillus odorifer]OMD92709.1 hypothetical protein BSK67_18270 [Paenibacillus odorifer]